MGGRNRIEKSITIDATVEEVWRALTDAEELRRWFPLDARVKPGEGGSLWLSWGEGSEWESPIEIWQPGKRLRTVDTMPAEPGREPRKIAVDYIIEGAEGATTLRIVHSGFADDAWDDELDTMDGGWGSFLETLRHYLERHKGEPRRLAFARHAPVPLPRPEVFRRTMAALGLDPASLRAGERYATITEGGDRFEGTVRLYQPPIHVIATVENLGDALLMVEIEPGRERCRPALWLSLFGEAGEGGDEIERRLRALLRSAFPDTMLTEG